MGLKFSETNTGTYTLRLKISIKEIVTLSNLAVNLNVNIMAAIDDAFLQRKIFRVDLRDPKGPVLN